MELSSKTFQKDPPKRRNVKAKRQLQHKTVQLSADTFEDWPSKSKETSSLQESIQEESKNSLRLIDKIKINCEDDNQTGSLDMSEQQRSSIDNTYLITSLEKPISPSLSNIDADSFSKSPEHLQFDCSNEILHPTAPRRTTFELESSITDISLLKSVSENDSVRMNSIPSIPRDQPLPVSSCTFSKVTVRKKWVKSNTVTTHRSSPSWASSSSSDCTPQKNPLSSKTSTGLLKNVLSKGKTRSTKKKVGSSVKMPDFAAIHQRAFDRMENLSEYKKRKEARAKMLLSGQKPMDQKNNVKEPNKTTRKQLTFAYDVVYKEQSPTHIPLPSTPRPKVKHVDEVQTPNFRFTEKKETSPPVFVKHQKTEDGYFNMKTPNFKFAQKKEKSTPMAVVQPRIGNRYFNVKTPNFKFTNGKENGFIFFKGESKKGVDVEVAQKSKLPVLRDKNFQKPTSSNVCNNKHVLKKKKEELKIMVATKSNFVKIDPQDRRTIIKGVRSNRRFELLMNMRKGK